jgi:hypothetical protein
MIGDDQVVSVDGIGRFGDAFKNIRFWNPLEFEPGFIFFVNRLDFDLLCVGQQRADDKTRFVAERLHSEQRVRRLMGQFNEAAQFIFGEQHNG